VVVEMERVAVVAKPYCQLAAAHLWEGELRLSQQLLTPQVLAVRLMEAVEVVEQGPPKVLVAVVVVAVEQQSNI
jgi:hypothetical protein